MVRHAPTEGILCISLRPPGMSSLIEGRSMWHTIGYVATSMYLDKSQFSYYIGTFWEDSRHFSVAPYITICPSTETYFGLYLRGAMSAVTGIYLFRLLLNIIFFVLIYFSTLTNSAYPDEMPHDGISPVCKCKKTCTE